LMSAKYTLVSVAAPPASGNGSLNSGGGNGNSTGSDRNRLVSRAERSFGKHSVANEMSSLDTLLLADEASPRARDQAPNPVEGAQSGAASGNAALGPTPPPGEPEDASHRSASRPSTCADNARDQSKASRNRKIHHPEVPKSPNSEVFYRLARDAPKPWVATQTDVQLLSYLAHRAKDPQIASPTSSTFSSRSTPHRRRRHQNPRELFDTCLDRAESGCAPRIKSPVAGDARIKSPVAVAPRIKSPVAGARIKSPVAGERLTSLDTDGRHSAIGNHRISALREALDLVPQKGHGNGAQNRLSDFLQDIPIIPGDPVTTFFQAEEHKKRHGLCDGLLM